MKHLIYFIAIVAGVMMPGCKKESKTSVEPIKANEMKFQSGVIASIGDQPTLAISDNNIIGTAFGDKETIYYSASKDGGKTFETAQIVGELKGLMLGYSSGPQIEFTASNIVITAPSKTGNLYAWSKPLDEQSWEGPYRINDVEKSVEECLSAITTTNDGVLYCTWIDTRFLENMNPNHHEKTTENHVKTKSKKEENLDAMTPIGITKKQLYDKIGEIPENSHLAFHDDSEGNLLWVFKDDNDNVIKAENFEAYKAFKKRNGERAKPQGKIYMSSSKDAGKTWSKSQLVYRSPDGSVCECCKPSIESDTQGNLAIMFRNNKNGSRDLHYTKSTDKGMTFSEPEKMGSGTWLINGCPMDGGGLTNFDRGEFMTVWQREGQIYKANSSLDEEHLGEGRSPSIYGNHKNYSIVYTIGETIMAMHEPKSIAEAIGQGNAPKVIHTTTSIVYIWTGEKGIEYKTFNKLK